MQPMQPSQPPQQPQMPQQQSPQQAATSWFKSLTTPKKWGIGCAGLILACVICAACGGLAQAITGNSTGGSTSQVAQATDTPEPPTNTPKPKQWHTIQSFKGNQNQQSETFHISSDQWRIVWSEKLNDAGYGSGLFEATLYTSHNETVDLVANVANQSSGATYNAHVGPGDYYIKIESLYADYDVQVQEYS